MLRIHQRTIFTISLLCLLLAIAVNVRPVAAQESNPVSAPTVTANEIKDVADELWCPLCSGVRLDACELKACEQMRDVIADKLAAGEPKDEIKNYFVAQYGPQVMGEPPMEGFNWLAWLLPVAAVVGGGIFVWYRTRKMIAASTEESSVPATAATDAYQDRLQEELKHYD
jgi:cytochrome c-type biogenesis protein CcmH